MQIKKIKNKEVNLLVEEVLIDQEVLFTIKRRIKIIRIIII